MCLVLVSSALHITSDASHHFLRSRQCHTVRTSPDISGPVNRGDHMNEKNDQFINLRNKVPDSLFKFEGKSCRMKCKGSHDGGVMVVVVVVVAKGPNKSQHTKLIMEKEILPPLLPGFELATFRSRVRRSTNKLPGSLSSNQQCT